MRPLPKSSFVFLALASALVVSDAQLVIHDLNSDQVSWGELTKRAGYRSSTGRWRGGLPRSARSQEQEFYTCKEVDKTGGFCKRWSVDESSADEFEQGSCQCIGNTDSYCQTWECTQVEVQRFCRGSVEGDCVFPGREVESTNCACQESSSNENYCKTWSCLEFNIKGSTETENYTCLVEDVSEKYCYRWRGDISSAKELESSVCECFRRREDHCDHWQCREREMPVCDRYGSGWCKLEVSIGVLGGISSGILSGVVVIAIFRRCNNPNGGSVASLLLFFFAFCVCVLPWSIGVAITGGVYGVTFVALAWSVPSIVLFLFLRIYRCSKRRASTTNN